MDSISVNKKIGAIDVTALTNKKPLRDCRQVSLLIISEF